MHLAEYRSRAALLADFLPWAALIVFVNRAHAGEAG
jgi:hypothetical protein